MNNQVTTQSNHTKKEIYRRKCRIENDIITCGVMTYYPKFSLLTPLWEERLYCPQGTCNISSWTPEDFLTEPTPVVHGYPSRGWREGEERESDREAESGSEPSSQTNYQPQAALRSRHTDRQSTTNIQNSATLHSWSSLPIGRWFPHPRPESSVSRSGHRII